MSCRISVFGLGKLGMPLAAVLASKGHEVVGFDVHDGLVDSLNRGVALIQEPDLQKTIDAGHSRLRATHDWKQAVLDSEATFIIVPTPSDGNGAFSNQFVLDCVEKIGTALREKDSYHLVVVTSTVMPGSTGGPIRQTLEQASGRQIGDRLGLCYNPEFIAIGSVIRDMLFPDLLLIGESDPKAGAMLEAIYAPVCESKPAVERMNFINAELSKISINTYVTAKITYANMLAGLCERLPGADADVVTRALGRDSRIGGKYLKGAIGYGGPCFPRDNVAFAHLATRLGGRADMAEATDRLNQYQIERLRDLIVQNHQGGAIGVMGLSYKIDTAMIEQSQPVALCQALADLGWSVVIHDPMAMDNAKAELGNKVTVAASVADLIERCDTLVVTTPWPVYRNLPADALAHGGKRRRIIDCWRLYRDEDYQGLADIVHVGRGYPAVEK